MVNNGVTEVYDWSDTSRENLEHIMLGALPNYVEDRKRAAKLYISLHDWTNAPTEIMFYLSIYTDDSKIRCDVMDLHLWKIKTDRELINIMLDERIVNESMKDKAIAVFNWTDVSTDRLVYILKCSTYKKVTDKASNVLRWDILGESKLIDLKYAKDREISERAILLLAKTFGHLGHRYPKN